MKLRGNSPNIRPVPTKSKFNRSPIFKTNGTMDSLNQHVSWKTFFKRKYDLGCRKLRISTTFKSRKCCYVKSMLNNFDNIRFESEYWVSFYVWNVLRVWPSLPAPVGRMLEIKVKYQGSLNFLLVEDFTNTQFLFIFYNGTGPTCTWILTWCQFTWSLNWAYWATCNIILSIWLKNLLIKLNGEYLSKYEM